PDSCRDTLAGMRRRVLIWISLGLNVVLAAVLTTRFQRQPAHTPATNADRPPPPTTNALGKTNTIVRRLNFVWSQIETRDYRAYIATLRSIGCPEPTTRDIIVAEVNEIFAKRRETEVVTVSQQWWRAEPDPEVLAATAAKLKALETERRAMLTGLLGREW